MGTALLVIGLIIILGAFAFNIYLLRKLKFNDLSEDFKNEIKEYLFLLLTSLITSIGCFFSIFGSLINANKSIEPLNMFLFVLSSILLFSGLLFLIDNFVLKYYKTNKSKGFARVIDIVFYSLIPINFIFICVLLSNLPLDYPLVSGFSINENGFIWTTMDSTSSQRSGFHVQFYAIFILCGAVFVFLLCNHRLKVKYGKKDMITSTFFIAFPMGIIGARLWYCYVLEFNTYANDFLSVLKIWEGGLGIMGGALLGIISGVLWVIFVKKEIKILDAIDMIVPTILIAQAIGRWGNFFNGEVYGYSLFEINDSIRILIPKFIQYQMSYVSGGAIEGIKFALPLFYVEFFTNLIGYFVIRYVFETQLISRGISKLTQLVFNLFKKELKNTTIDKLNHCFPIGGCSGMYLIWYGITRVILEPLRYTTDYYADSITSAYILIGLGAGMILVCGIYQFLLNDKFPKLSARLYFNKETDYLGYQTNNNEEITKSESISIYNNIDLNKKEKNNKKVSNKDSLNDEILELLDDDKKDNE